MQAFTYPLQSARVHHGEPISEQWSAAQIFDGRPVIIAVFPQAFTPT